MVISRGGGAEVRALAAANGLIHVPRSKRDPAARPPEVDRRDCDRHRARRVRSDDPRSGTAPAAKRAGARDPLEGKLAPAAATGGVGASRESLAGADHPRESP